MLNVACVDVHDEVEHERSETSVQIEDCAESLLTNAGGSESTSPSEISSILQDNYETAQPENVEKIQPENSFVDTSKFLEICAEMINSQQATNLPADWIPQVIMNGLECIMWTQWTQGYTKMLKRIILFSDMRINVRSQMKNKKICKKE